MTYRVTLGPQSSLWALGFGSGGSSVPGHRLVGGLFMADARLSTNFQDRAFPTSSAPAQTLSSEAVLDALKMILLGAPLNEILTSVARLIEAHSEGMLCSIFLVEQDGLHLRYGAAPNLPEAYRASTDATCIGPDVGSCGRAAYVDLKMNNGH
jgi:hypothetical protein